MITELFIKLLGILVGLRTRHNVLVSTSRHKAFPFVHHLRAETTISVGFVNVEQIKEWDGLPKQAVSQYANNGILQTMILAAVFDGIVLEYIDLAVPNTLTQAW